MATKKDTEPDKGLTFEAGMKRLQEVVERLEEQDIALEEAVKLFEEGMEISRRCSRILEEAEEKVKLLVKDRETGRLKLEEMDQEKGDFTP